MHRTDVEVLFALYREPVYRFLRRFLHDGAAAEDLTQEAFLRALTGTWQAHAGHHADDGARAWIFQIARNLARDHLRARARQPPPGPLAEHEGPTRDPLARLALELALDTVHVDDREVFLLKEIGGLSYAEIAAACGLTLDAVRSRLHRTRLALRRQLT